MEAVGELGKHFGCIARGIYADEQRLDLRAQLGIGLLERLETGHCALGIDRTDVGAIGIAEIERAVLGVEIAPADILAGLTREREFLADGGTCKRGLGRGGLLAGGKREQRGEQGMVAYHRATVHEC